MEAQQPGRPLGGFDPAFGIFQGLFQVIGDKVVERGPAFRPRRRGLAFFLVSLDVDVQLWGVAGVNERTFYGMFQFADIAGPVIGAQGLNFFFQNPDLGREVQTLRLLVQKVSEKALPGRRESTDVRSREERGGAFKKTVHSAAART